MNTNPFVSVVIPAYNEASRINPTLLSVSHFFAERGLAYEVVVVDDGSTDGTHSLVQAYCAENPNFRLVIQPRNAGKGAAVARGMLESRGAWRLFMDADSSVAIEHLDAFLAYAMLGCDIVIGSIEMTIARHDTNGWHRKALRSLAKRLIRTLATPGIRDTQRGFKLFSGPAAEGIFPRLTVTRFGFDIEALMIAQRHGYQIMEAPVLWHNPRGHAITLRSYGVTLIELARILIRAWTGAYRPEGVKKTGGQLIRFCIAGAVNTAVDFAVFNALYFAFGGAGLVLSFYKGTGFTAAVVNSFFWNKYFVFDGMVHDASAKGGGRISKHFAKFLVVSGGGLFINTLAFAAAHFFLTAHTLFSNAIIANGAAAIATLVALFFNFIGYKYFVFVRSNQRSN